MNGGVSEPGSTPAAHPHHRTLHALEGARGQIQKYVLKVLLYAVVAVLLLRLTPSLRQAFNSLGSVEWQWLVVMLAVETLSELGFVTSWRRIVDADNMLGREGRGNRLASRVAWAQLGGGLVVPGGTYAGLGVGAWILHRLGMPLKQIAERQFELSFLNTAIDALALIFGGVGLALGIFAGKRDLLLTAVPAAVGAAGLLGAIAVAHRAEHRSERLRERHPRVATVLDTLARAVDDTETLLFRRVDWRSVAGALAYLFFDVSVLYIAFYAVNAPTIPPYFSVLMAYIIGALGGSLPLPAGIGAVGGIAGFLILYGVPHTPAVAAAVVYGAVGLVVPLAGGAFSYLLLRRQFGDIKPTPAESASPA